MPDGETLAGERVGPRPEPAPDRLNTWTVLDLLATTRRWRVREAFVAGQADGLARALIACLNRGQAAPPWLRRALLAFLLEALWEQPPPATAAAQAAWDATVEDLVRRWRDPPSWRTGSGRAEGAVALTPRADGRGCPG